MATLSPSLPQADPIALAPSLRYRSYVLVGLCFLAAILPLVVAHGRQLWLRPHYQFFPILLLGAAVLAWSRLRSAPLPVPAAPRLGAFLASLTWLLLAGAILLDSSWLATVAAQVGFAAVAVGIGGPVLFRRLLPAWVLLWLAVPPPFEYDRTVILFLQTLTTQQSSALLDLFGVFHTVSGHLFEVNGRRLLVEQACGGINSLLSVMACTIFFVFFVRRPPVRAVLLIVSALLWVMVANVARVVLVVLLYVRWGTDLTSGFRHDALGLLLFTLALGLIWSTDRLLAFLTTPIWPRTGEAAPDDSPRLASGRPASWSWLTCWPFGVAFALLVVLQVTEIGSAKNPFAQGPTLPTLNRLHEDTLPAALGDCQRTGFAERVRDLGSEFGEKSSVWTYRVGSSEAVLSLDHPFPGWHDLTRCYTTQGWMVAAENTIPALEKDGDSVGYVELRLTKPGYRTGYLLYCQFDGRGVVLEPRASGADLSLHRQVATMSRLFGKGNEGSAFATIDPPGPVYQFQLFVESFTPLSPEEEKQARQLFQTAVQKLRR
jgi:exosortase